MFCCQVFFLTSPVYASDGTDAALDQFDFDKMDDTLADFFPENPPKFREMIERLISGEDSLNVEELQKIFTSLFTYA